MIIQFSDLIESSPMSPGIYKMYDAEGTLLYIGKAKNIKARLRQYLDTSKLELHKQIMRTLVTNVTWETTKTESDALILEEQLIKTQKPKYNIMMRDGKMYPMLALTNSEFPRLLKFRGKISQKRDVFGPYPSVSALNETIKTIQKVCKLRTCTDTFMKNRTRPCLLYQIGRCSAPCVIHQTSYNENVQLARKILTGYSEPIIADLSEKMKKFSDNMDFESAAQMRDKIAALTHTSVRGIKNYTHQIGINWNESVNELEKWLGIKIDQACVFDNSHLFGKTPVGSMIVFGHDGFIKSNFRHFKLKDAARAGNDIAMMEEFITRAIAWDKDINLIIVDGGMAQWNIAHKTAPTTPILGVTKGLVRDGDEHFIIPNGKTERNIPKDSKLFLLLRAVRDEAHRFAISFHRAQYAKTMTASKLDDIEGIGPTRKRALLNHFGSVRQIADAELNALIHVPGLGKSAAEKIYSYFH
ncbi:MAG: excinuclease ABC subunit UvrC [Alphaproteobacteria bacterium]|nr:excinuclease ABC subunit UvrC [Alphaproteobacteria bacterium]MBN2675158.1 excinuclease ABC subunit UvrC [Alphaproteobacteria bacterium]